MTSLSDVIETTATIKWKEQPKNLSFQYVDLTSVNRSTHQITNTTTINSQNAPSRAQKIIRTNDILFGTTRPTLNRVCIVPDYLNEQICSTGLCILRPDTSKIIPEYLYYLLTTPKFISYIEATQRGTSYPAVTDKDVKKFNFALPSLQEQKNIVNKLKKVFKAIDDAHKLNHLSIGYISQLKLTALKSKLNTGKEEIKLKEIFLIGSSKRVLKSQWRKKGVPFYRGREITKLSLNGIVDNDLYIDESLYNELTVKHGSPQAGDIMLTAIGTIGNSYIVKSDDKFYFKDASVLWLKKNIDVNTEYINYWLRSPHFLSQIENNGTTVNTLTITKLQNISIKLPDLYEQDAIAKEMSNYFQKLDKMSDLMTKKSAYFTSLKTSILSKSFQESVIE